MQGDASGRSASLKQEIAKLTKILGQLEKTKGEIPLSAKLQVFSSIEETKASLDSKVLPDLQRDVLQPQIEKLKDDLEGDLKENLKGTSLYKDGNAAEIERDIQDYLNLASPDTPAADLLAKVLLESAKEREARLRRAQSIEMWRGILQAVQKVQTTPRGRLSSKALQELENTAKESVSKLEKLEAERRKRRIAALALASFALIVVIGITLRQILPNIHPSPTPTPLPPPSHTPTFTPSPTLSSTATPTPTLTSTPTDTPTYTPTHTPTSTPTPTRVVGALPCTLRFDDRPYSATEEITFAPGATPTVEIQWTDLKISQKKKQDCAPFDPKVGEEILSRKYRLVPADTPTPQTPGLEIEPVGDGKLSQPNPAENAWIFTQIFRVKTGSPTEEGTIQRGFTLEYQVEKGTAAEEPKWQPVEGLRLELTLHYRIATPTPTVTPTPTPTPTSPTVEKLEPREGPEVGCAYQHTSWVTFRWKPVPLEEGQCFALVYWPKDEPNGVRHVKPLVDIERTCRVDHVDVDLGPLEIEVSYCWDVVIATRDSQQGWKWLTTPKCDKCIKRAAPPPTPTPTPTPVKQGEDTND